MLVQSVDRCIILALAQPLIGGMAQPSIGGPRTIRDFGNQRRAYADDTPFAQLDSGLVHFQSVRGHAQPACFVMLEPGSSVSHMDEPVAKVSGERKA